MNINKIHAELAAIECTEADDTAQVAQKIKAVLAKHSARRVVVKAFANGLGLVRYEDSDGNAIIETYEPIDITKAFN